MARSPAATQPIQRISNTRRVVVKKAWKGRLKITAEAAKPIITSAKETSSLAQAIPQSSVNIGNNLGRELVKKSSNLRPSKTVHLAGSYRTMPRLRRNFASKQGIDQARVARQVSHGGKETMKLDATTASERDKPIYENFTELKANGFSLAPGICVFIAGVHTAALVLGFWLYTSAPSEWMWAGTVWLIAHFLLGSLSTTLYSHRLITHNAVEACKPAGASFLQSIWANI